MKFIVEEKIKHLHNLHVQDIAAFVQASDAVMFAKFQAKKRKQYDNNTPFQYAVKGADGEFFSSFYNKSEL